MAERVKENGDGKEGRNSYPNIHEALVAAQAAAQAVEKRATNTWHKYQYADAESIIAEGRYALNGCGLATTMAGWSIHAKAENEDYDRVLVTFTTFHNRSNDKISGGAEYYIIPEKGKQTDKALAGALTLTEAYYLRGLLCLPRVRKGIDVGGRDDLEHDPVVTTAFSKARVAIRKTIKMADLDYFWRLAQDRGFNDDQLRTIKEDIAMKRAELPAPEDGDPEPIDPDPPDEATSQPAEPTVSQDAHTPEPSGGGLFVDDTVGQDQQTPSEAKPRSRKKFKADTR